MASVSIKIEGLNDAIKGVQADVDALLVQADRKFKVAGARMETYAKAKAPVDKGFHRRNIRHDPAAPFLSTSLTAAAKYASVLELGFDGVVNVSGHTRTNKKTGKSHSVSAHTRRMNRPARPHIIPGAERALKQLIEDLNGLVK